MQPWKTIDSKLAFDQRWFKVRQDKVELPTGKILDDYYIWQNDDVSMVVPVTKDKKFVLIKQYRQAAGQFTIEFPVGYVNKGELPEEAAKRELTEETGYTAHQLIHLSTLTNNASKETGKIYIYLAEDAENSNKVHFDESEEIETLLVTPPEVINMLSNGDIWISCSVVAAYSALFKLNLLSISK